MIGADFIDEERIVSMKDNVISESMFREIVDSLSEENMKEFVLLNGALEYYGDTYYLKGDEKYE